MPANRESTSDPDERPDTAGRFESNLKRILSVPKTELVKREAAYQKSRENKNRRPRGSSSKPSK